MILVGCGIGGILLGLGICAIVGVLGSGLFSGGGGDRAERRLPSPDGSKVLVTSVNNSRADMTRYLTIEFEIRDAASQTVLFSEQTGASSRLAWDIRWLSDTEIQLDSSDIGTYCWQEQAGAWASVSCPP